MFPVLPFEFRPRQRAIPYEDLARLRRVMEQRDRELEEFLARVCLEPCGAGGAGAGARWVSNESDAVFSGSLQPVYFQVSPVAWSEGYSAFIANEAGETNERTRAVTPGFYTATVTAYSPQGGDFFIRMWADTAASSGEAPDSVAGAWSQGDGTESAATAFTSWALQANDTFRVSVKGVEDDTFVLHLTVEYVAPYGGEFSIPEG